MPPAHRPGHAISHAAREVTAELAAGHVTTLGYDVLVVAPGSVARTLPIPGLAEHGIAFKTVGEAIYLRNHVLSRLDAAATTIDPALRRRLLTFLVVGGGYAGIEALAELQDMARYATRYYENIDATTCAGSSSRRPGGSCPRSARRWAATRSSG